MKPTHICSQRRGIVTVFVAVCLVGLIGVAAIAVDGGLLYLYLRDARSIADASAMAAACDLYKNYPANAGKDPGGDAASAALAVAAANGFANDGTATIVTVNIPPKTGNYVGKDGYVEVIVTRNSERNFSRIFGSDPIPVRARAVARGEWTSPNAGVIVLDYNDKASLNSQGNGAFTETGAPVIINSNNPSAVVSAGNGKLVADSFYVTGGSTLVGNGSITTSPIDGQIFTGTHPTPDPLAYLPVPPVPANGTMTTTSLTGGNHQYTLTPGRYTNLPTFNPGDVVVLKQASANINGGIYYIDGGGFKSTGATITMDPNTTGGMMLYNKPSSTSDKVQITGNPDGSVNLGPLSEGPYSGMGIWQDRTSNVPLLIEGNGNFTINGTFYAAGALLNVNGNGRTTGSEATGYYLDDQGGRVDGGSRIGSQFIVNNLSLGGNGNVNINYKKSLTARTRIITLVE